MRVDDAQQADDELQTWQRERQDPVSPECPAVGSPARFDPFELGSVMLNLDASLRIRARHQFFGWTHGTHDATGQLTSFFTFACRPGSIGPRQAYYVELLVPFLHAAWVRTQVNWQAKSAGARPAVTGFLTPREREILEWIYRGKSNIEVGMILKISPLTAKNHVQKILRKLGVLNRTQAVGKALALRILTT